jgi:hypothetical protein
MKTLFTITVPALLAIVILIGCKSDPDFIGYSTPAHLVSQIEPADHIIVVSAFRNAPGVSHFASFTTTIKGKEMNSIIRTISSLRAPGYGVPTNPSDCAYEWELQFYRGTKMLGSVDLGYCLVRCDGVEYHAPALKSLWHRIARESGEED